MNEHTFVLRIWRLESDQPGWRARLQYVQGSETVSVQTLDELLNFIQQWTGELKNPPEQPARSGLR